MVNDTDTKYAGHHKVYVIARSPYDMYVHNTIDYIFDLTLFSPPIFKRNNEPP